MSSIGYHDLSFDREMLFARRGDGSEIRFTRQERALLLQLALQPGKLQTRERLIEFMSRDGTDANDRNVDFLVNRLRRRLGDDARRPRFIATRYGEGYVWIATPTSCKNSDAFLVIGPIFGLRYSDAIAEEALNFLTGAFQSLFGPERTIVRMPNWSPSQDKGDVPFYSLDASFHSQDQVLHAAFILRHGRFQNVIGAFRAKFDCNNARSTANDIAEQVKGALWAHIGLPNGSIISAVDTPLHIRMHDAARFLSHAPTSWRENEKQLIKARTANPGDPTLDIMWGLNLYARLLQHVRESEPMSEAEWAGVEDEIEALALSSLPKVSDNPLLILAVAKLLLFIDRGHVDLASRLADEAFESSTAFAAAFALQGQIHMFQGRITEALVLYDKGIEMSEFGSEFHVYLVVLKCIGLLAADERMMLERLTDELYALRPDTRLQFGVMLAPSDPDGLPADIEAKLSMLDAARAGKLILYLFNISARRFRSPTHRRNVMKGLLAHMVRRFGAVIVPAAVEKALQAGNR